jgi:small subunit ribosomal protein S6
MFKEYEVMILVRPDLSESELTKYISRWEDILTNQGGIIIAKDVWKNKKISYPIEGFTKGVYLLYVMACPKENIAEMKRISLIDDSIMRMLAIKLSDTVDIEARKASTEAVLKDIIATTPVKVNGANASVAGSVDTVSTTKV